MVPGEWMIELSIFSFMLLSWITEDGSKFLAALQQHISLLKYGEEVEKICSSWIFAYCYTQPFFCRVLLKIILLVFIPFPQRLQEVYINSFIFSEMKRLGHHSKWHVHDHVAEKQACQDSDSGPLTHAMSCTLSSTPRCLCSSGKGIKAWNKNNSKINNWIFSICSVLDRVSQVVQW